MLSDSRAYRLKFTRVLIPMAKGGRSRRVLDIAYDISSVYGCEITALTIKDEFHDVSWSEKVSLVTNTFKEGRNKGIKVVPKIRTKGSVRECIADEANSHGYSAVMIAAGKRSPLSASIFGGIGDYVLKNSKVPVIAASASIDGYPYKSIFLPVAETMNTRTAVSFALNLKKATGATLYLADLRSYDTRRTHGFKLLFDRPDEMIEKYGKDIIIMNGSGSDTLREEVQMLIEKVSPSVTVLGVRTDQSGRFRMSSSVKGTIKENPGDTILVKK